ncbi:NAD(P)-binding protein [Amniculicola lignicola CBS 123094]|uniref:NAD(P)-binding protein n=1 Tax=Amniculicola lignicola CBS 123094 TaxID=1392246 RepID=A0A6A5WDH6_9PLEO|nr:NAD(P)-binding protein [Amniculicola lignicola CBS 123094]
MVLTILVAGATGNTGRSVVETLSTLLKPSTSFSDHRILALTRNANGPAAQQLAKLPGVEVVEKNWAEVTSEWFMEQNIVRTFIAPHNQPNAFSEESHFLVSALTAGVKYVVRISTTELNDHPDSKAYYARTHWAIETMLSTPGFSKMHWTSLQPATFSSQVLYSAVDFVKQFRKTGKQDTLRLIVSEDAPVALIDPADIGRFAATLLSQEDTSVHNQAKYVMNGPKDMSGKEIVDLIEKEIGTKVDNVIYADRSFIDYMVAAAPNESKSVISSIKYAAERACDGNYSTAPTSKEVLEIAKPERTPEDMMKLLLSM